MLSFTTIHRSTPQGPHWLISAFPARIVIFSKSRFLSLLKTKKLLQARALIAGEIFFLMKLGPSFSLRFWSAPLSTFFFLFFLISHRCSFLCLIVLIPLQCLFPRLACTFQDPLSHHFQYLWDNPTSHQFCWLYKNIWKPLPIYPVYERQISVDAACLS